MAATRRSRLQQLLPVVRIGLYMGTTVFGGIALAYPVIRQRASELGDIADEEVDALYALSIFLPGPSFLNLWGAVSARTAGLLGAVLAEVALMAPGVLLVLLLPLTTRVPYIGAHTEGALQGAIWATAGLMIAAAIDYARKLKGAALQVMATAGTISLLLGLHPLLLMLLMLGAGAALGVLPRLGQAQGKGAA